MKPSRSTVILCGLTKRPAPKLRRNLPEVSNCSTGSSGELAHVVPPAPEAPHRSSAQMVPSGAVAIPAVDPHFLPFGSCPQLVPALWAFGRSLRAPSGETSGSSGNLRGAGAAGGACALNVRAAPIASSAIDEA